MILDEQPITIAEAARFYPKGTRSTTIIRHITRGIKTPRGIVRLEASRIGKRWTTTAGAIERFRAACTNCYADVTSPSPSSRIAAQKRAAAFLDSIGLK